MFIWKFPSDALYLSPYSNHSNENGYKKAVRERSSPIFTHLSIRKYSQPFLLSNNSYKNLKAARLRGSFREI